MHRSRSGKAVRRPAVGGTPCATATSLTRVTIVIADVSEVGTGEQQGVVLSGTGGIWRVRRDDGDVVEASLRGRVKKSNSGRRADGSLRRDTISSAAETLKLAIGDRVLLDRDEAGGTSAIAENLSRRLRLARRTPGGGHGGRVVAAHVGQGVLVVAPAHPGPP